MDELKQYSPAQTPEEAAALPDSTAEAPEITDAPAAAAETSPAEPAEEASPAEPAPDDVWNTAAEEDASAEPRAAERVTVADIHFRSGGKTYFF